MKTLHFINRTGMYYKLHMYNCTYCIYTTYSKEVLTNIALQKLNNVQYIVYCEYIVLDERSIECLKDKADTIFTVICLSCLHHWDYL